MSAGWKGLLIAAPVIVVLAVAAAFKLAGVHDELASQRAGVAAQWAQVDAALEARADLIPDLADTVKRIAPHETEVFQNIAAARAALAGGRQPEEKMQANDRLSDALARLLVAAENYPKLRSNKDFQRLQDEIGSSENRIAIERRKYNEILEHYNAQIQLFPDNVVASMSGFRRNDAYFRTDGANRGAPKMQF
jgi:LemA protein